MNLKEVSVVINNCLVGNMKKWHNESNTLLEYVL